MTTRHNFTVSGVLFPFLGAVIQLHHRRRANKGRKGYSGAGIYSAGDFHCGA